MNGPARRVTWFAIAFYGVLALAGLAWMLLRGDALPEALLGPRERRLTALLAGIAAALAIVLVSDVALERFAWTRLLRREVADLFAPWTAMRAFVLAASSAAGEEILFRGALQPAIGLVAASLVFGVLHGMPDPRLVGWALFAAAAGLVFGGLALWSGGLLAPAVAHALVNGIQLARLARAAPESAGRRAGE